MRMIFRRNTLFITKEKRIAHKMIPIQKKILFGACWLLPIFGLAAAETLLNLKADTGTETRIERAANPAGKGKVFAFSCAVDRYASLKLPKSPGANYTLTAWFNPDGIPDRIGKFTLLGEHGGRLRLSYLPSKQFEVEFKLANGKREVIKTRALPSDRWYHVAFVCLGDKRRARIYVNGEIHHQSVIADAPAPPEGELFLGCADPAAARPFWCNGFADEIRLYDTVFESWDVKKIFQGEAARYTLPKTPVPTGKAQAARPFVLLPPFADNAVSERKKQLLRKEIPVQLEQYLAAIRKYRAEIDAYLGARSCFQKERIGKRVEIVGNLAAFIRKNLDSGDLTGLCSAANGIRDMKRFVDYFQLEAECIAKFPWLPEGGLPGNNPKIFSVRDFGAKGDGVTDDSAAFVRALDAVKQCAGAPAVLRIPSGVYFFNSFVPAKGKPAEKGGCHVRIPKLENALIEGENPETTKFLFGRPQAAGIFMDACRNVTVRNLMLQYKKTPFCQGTVLEVNVPANTVTIQLDPGTLAPDDPVYKANPRFQCCTAYTPDGRLVRTQFLVYNEKKADSLGNGKYRIYMDRRYSVRHVRPGLKFVIPNRDGAYPCFPTGDSTLCTAENIYIRNSPAAAFQTWGGFWNSWTKCRLYPLPGLCLASNADFLISGNGTYLSRCSVKNPGDDCFNVFVGGKNVVEAEGTHARYPAMPGRSIPGNTLAFLSGETGQTLALATIKSQSRMGGDTVAVLEEALPDTIVSRKKGGLKKLSPVQEDLVSRALIRYEFRRDAVYDSRQWGIGSVASGNSFAHARAGINIQSACSLVENNTFENIPMGVGIAVSCLLGVHEGPAPYCITVRGNTVNDAWAGLRTFTFVQNMAPAQCAPIRALVFENNRWSNTGGLIVKNLSDSVFRGNTIAGGNGVNSFGEKMNRISVDRSANLLFSGNVCLGRPLTQNDLLLKECGNGILVK